MDVNELRRWLEETPSERRGGFVLVLTIFGIGILFNILADFRSPEEVKLSKEHFTKIESLLIAHEAKKERYARDRDKRSKDIKIEITPSQYDPNTVSYDGLIAMGIPKRTATIWINFRDKGGRFRKPADIQSIYTMDENIYQALLPFTIIAESERTPQENKKRYPPNPRTTPQKTLFSFDPNTISKDSLDLLNIPARLASSIIGYRKAGGIFRTVEKLKSSPGMTDSIYEAVYPYVTIDSSYQLKKKEWESEVFAQEKPMNILTPLNLNTADSSELIKIKGIGAFRAKILIERRENIGGFYELDQLFDGLYSIDSAVVEQIRRYLYVDDSYRRIDLRATDYKTLRNNYYFSKNMATTAINYFKHRDQEGHLDDFIKNSPLSREKWKKVRPYLTLED
jgi:DNA uptake protein ComE-like DNA-binding protein